MADLDLDAIEDAVALGSKGNARTTLALVAEVRRLRAVRDAAETVVGRAEMVSTRDQIPVTVQVGIDRLAAALEGANRG